MTKILLDAFKYFLIFETMGMMVKILNYLEMKIKVTIRKLRNVN